MNKPILPYDFSGLPDCEMEAKPLPTSETEWSEPSCSGFNEIAEVIAKLFLCGLIAMAMGCTLVWLIGGGL